jgi:hypothetical protein
MNQNTQRKYPKIGYSRRIDKGICKICKRPAKYQVDIEVNIFRGDDEVEKRCEEHKRTL